MQMLKPENKYQNIFLGKAMLCYLKQCNTIETKLETCMGMGNAGFPSFPWDSHGNGNQIA